MVLYQCSNCNFETKDKGKFTRHCNRKFPCKKKEITIISQSEENEKTQITQNYSNLLKNYSNYSNLLKNYSFSKDKQENIKNNYDQNKSTTESYICLFCNKQFSRKYNYQRHLNTCKSLKNKKSDSLHSQNYLHIKDLEEKTRNLEEKVDELTNAKSIINNIVNNYNYNITINAYGKENLEFLTDYKIRQLFSAFKDNLVVQLIKNIHPHYQKI